METRRTTLFDMYITHIIIHQNDITISCWRNNDVMITSCTRLCDCLQHLYRIETQHRFGTAEFVVPELSRQIHVILTRIYIMAFKILLYQNDIMLCGRQVPRLILCYLLHILIHLLFGNIDVKGVACHSILCPLLSHYVQREPFERPLTAVVLECFCTQMAPPLQSLHYYQCSERISLQWRHNGHDSVSNHQPHDSDADERKHQSSASLAFVREFTGDRWIPCTNGQ